jgi:hypothetical protein
MCHAPVVLPCSPARPAPLLHCLPASSLCAQCAAFRFLRQLLLCACRVSPAQCHHPLFGLWLASPLQIKKLLCEDFRNLSDFKAKASQYKPHTQTQHWDKQSKPTAQHHPGKGKQQHGSLKGANGTATPKSGTPRAGGGGGKQQQQQHIQVQVQTDVPAQNGGPASAAEPLAAASS